MGEIDYQLKENKDSREFFLTLNRVKKKIVSVDLLLDFPKAQHQYNRLFEEIRDLKAAKKNINLTAAEKELQQSPEQELFRIANSSVLKSADGINSSILENSLVFQKSTSNHALKTESPNINSGEGDILDAIDDIEEGEFDADTEDDNIKPLVVQSEIFDQNSKVRQIEAGNFSESPIKPQVFVASPKEARGANKKVISQFNEGAPLLNSTSTDDKKSFLEESLKAIFESELFKKRAEVFESLPDFQTYLDHLELAYSNTDSSQKVANLDVKKIKETFGGKNSNNKKSAYLSRGDLANIDEEGDDEDTQRIQEPDEQQNSLNKAFLKDNDESSFLGVSESNFLDSKSKAGGAGLKKKKVITTILGNDLEQEDQFEIFSRRYNQLKNHYNEVKKELGNPHTKQAELKKSLYDLSWNVIFLTVSDLLNLNCYIYDQLEGQKKVQRDIELLASTSELEKFNILIMKLGQKLKNSLTENVLEDEPPLIGNILDPNQPPRPTHVTIEIPSSSKHLKQSQSPTRLSLEKTTSENLKLQIGVNEEPLDGENNLSVIKQASEDSYVDEDEESYGYFAQNQIKIEKIQKRFVSGKKVREWLKKKADKIEEKIANLEEPPVQLFAEPDRSLTLSQSFIAETKSLDVSFRALEGKGMRVYNYFWAPRYMRTGVSSFPYDI